MIIKDEVKVTFFENFQKTLTMEIRFSNSIYAYVDQAGNELFDVTVKSPHRDTQRVYENKNLEASQRILDKHLMKLLGETVSIDFPE